MVKSFIYLDEDKMYSLSSQVFEGITDYLINTNIQSEDRNTSQEGPFWSGRFMADMLSEESGISEKRYLHDYAYASFEKYLTERKLVLDVNLAEEQSFYNSIRTSPFIKIKGKAIFNDVELIKKTLENFNEFGKALAHVTSHDTINTTKQQLEKSTRNIKDRNDRAAIERKIKSLTNLDKLAKDAGLQQDQSFLNSLAYLLSYGFQDQFEIQIRDSKHIFSANLKRDALKEKEDILIRKYSRKTEVEFVIFGIVTQYLENNKEEEKDKEDPNNIKTALMDMLTALHNIENSFIGRLSNEIVIDPIAVYQELNTIS
jgi:hypothetical protein